MSSIRPAGSPWLERSRPSNLNLPRRPEPAPDAVVPRRRQPGQFRPGYWALEVPVLLLLFSTLVFRQRDAQQLSANPLDQAALYRVACVGLALLLGWTALILDRRGANDHDGGQRLTTRPFRLFSFYVVVVFAGALTSVSLFLTAYRGVELAVLLIVYGGAWRTFGTAAARRVENVLYWWIVASIASVWLGVFLFPHEAIVHIASPIPWQIVGVYPAISSNGAGGLGGLLALWSLSRLWEERDTGATASRLLIAMAALGFVTLIAAQYRTGYAATTLGLVVLLALRRRLALAGLLFLVAIVVVIAGPIILARAQPYVLRGQTEQRASELSGRVHFWELAIPVWKESPLIGRGLLTASRFEVLEANGLGQISTIHGTWIEALVGTGIAGTALLAGSVLVTWRRALAEALRVNGRLLPIVIITIVSVQSVTGSDFAVFGLSTMLFMAVALSLKDAAPSAFRPHRVPVVAVPGASSAPSAARRSSGSEVF